MIEAKCAQSGGASFPLHALLGWNFCFPVKKEFLTSFIISVLKKMCRTNPLCATIKDVNGNLPIHIAVNNDRINRDNVELYEFLLRTYPSMVLLPNGDGKSALIQAIANPNCS